jgi:hypothetical protein
MSHFQTEGAQICGETRLDVPKLQYSHQIDDVLVIQNMALLSHMPSWRHPRVLRPTQRVKERESSISVSSRPAGRFN